MESGEEKYEKITKKIRIYLAFDPVRVLEGIVTIPSARTRLSDLLNDEKNYLPLQGVSVPDGWLKFGTDFVLLNKKEIKAVVELG
ncbi:MAG: DUF6812 domain-containing protein [Thermodesulfobacteriota bacterium]